VELSVIALLETHPPALHRRTAGPVVAAAGPMSADAAGSAR
jgi:hypothetical protein